MDAEIRDFGNMQVTAWGYDNAQCKVGAMNIDAVSVQCFGANGAAMDTYYAVLLGS